MWHVQYAGPLHGTCVRVITLCSCIKTRKQQPSLSASSTLHKICFHDAWLARPKQLGPMFKHGLLVCNPHAVSSRNAFFSLVCSVKLSEALCGRTVAHHQEFGGAFDIVREFKRRRPRQPLVKGGKVPTSVQLFFFCLFRERMPGEMASKVCAVNPRPGHPFLNPQHTPIRKSSFANMGTRARHPPASRLGQSPVGQSS